MAGKKYRNGTATHVSYRVHVNRGWQALDEVIEGKALVSATALAGEQNDQRFIVWPLKDCRNPVPERVGLQLLDGSVERKAIVQTPPLSGGFLFLPPAGASGLFGDLAATSVRERFQTAFATYPAPFAAHFGHDLRDDRPGGFRRLWEGVRLSHGRQDHATSILDGVELRLASALRHVPRSHGYGRFVKLEGISN